MIRACLPFVVALCLCSTAIAQQGLLPADLVTTQRNNGKLVVSADLSNLEQHLSDTLARTYANQSCGDRVAADNVALTGTGQRASLTATLTLTRWQCTKILKPVCKGFVCRKETQEIRNKIYEASFPLALDIRPDKRRRDALGFVVFARHASGVNKAFLGQEELFDDAARIFEQVASSSLEQLSSDIADNLPGPAPFAGFIPSTTHFSTSETGTLMLHLQLPLR